MKERSERTESKSASPGIRVKGVIECGESRSAVWNGDWQIWKWWKIRKRWESVACNFLFCVALVCEWRKWNETMAEQVRQTKQGRGVRDDDIIYTSTKKQSKILRIVKILYIIYYFQFSNIIKTATTKANLFIKTNISSSGLKKKKYSCFIKTIIF